MSRLAHTHQPSMDQIERNAMNTHDDFFARNYPRRPYAPPKAPPPDYILTDARDRELDHPREFWRGVGWGAVLSVPLYVCIGMVVWGLWVWSVP